MAVIVEKLDGVIQGSQQLKGEISTTSSLNGTISGRGSLTGEVNVGNSGGGTRDYEYLKNKPAINGVTLSGDQSSEELKIVEDKNFYYEHSGAASDTWVIVHNLNKYPSVSVIDSYGTEVIGEVTYDTINQITIKFRGAFKGKATLN